MSTSNTAVSCMRSSNARQLAAVTWPMTREDDEFIDMSLLRKLGTEASGTWNWKNAPYICRVKGVDILVPLHSNRSHLTAMLFSNVLASNRTKRHSWGWKKCRLTLSPAENSSGSHEGAAPRNCCQFWLSRLQNSVNLLTWMSSAVGWRYSTELMNFGLRRSTLRNWLNEL